MIKIVFLPGNGNSNTYDNWFSYIKKELEILAINNIEIIAAEFPDTDLARKSYWFSFLKNDLKVDSQIILVGHSSEAVAAMRFAQEYPILGSFLIGAYYTDLNIEKEKLSGYFSYSWNWRKIRDNQRYISLFASQDDPWIPIEQARYIHKKLACEYHEFKNRGHFGGDYVKKEFPELLISITNFLKAD